MMIGKLLIRSTVLVMALLALATAQAQSAKEWSDDFIANREHANIVLRQTFERVRDRAVSHYRTTNPPRADFVQAMGLDITDLEGFVLLAKSEDRSHHTSTSLEKVVQKYIVQKSQNVPDQKPQ